MKKITFLLFFLLVLAACKKDEASNNGGSNVYNPNDRQSVIDAYNNEYEYLGNSVTATGWNGDKANCIEGSLPDSTLNKVLRVVNYYRKIVGLAPCTFDTSLNKYAQKAALMCFANGELDHTPPTSWKCYTSAGAQACLYSNLASGGRADYAVYLWINDFMLPIVGHRRWVLYSKAKTFGFGAAGSYYALYGMHNTSNSAPTNLPEFIAYPPKGYVMRQMIYTYYGFGIPNADFSAAKVSIKMEDGTVKDYTPFTPQNGVGGNTLVWIGPKALPQLKTQDLM